MIKYKELKRNTRLIILALLLTAFALLLAYDVNGGFFIGLLGGLLISGIVAEIILFFKK